MNDVESVVYMPVNAAVLLFQQLPQYLLNTVVDLPVKLLDFAHCCTPVSRAEGMQL